MNPNNRKIPAPPASQEQGEDKEVSFVEEAKPSSEPKQPDSTVKVKPSVSGVEVVAVRDGFYRNSRKKAGDLFMISNLDKAGSWMKCLDPKVEKMHQQNLKERKQQAGK